MLSTRFWICLLLAAAIIAVAAACQEYPKRPGLLEATGVLPKPVEKRSDDVVVMTFNIRYGTADDGENAWGKRRDLLIQVIRDADPDIIGVQEALRFQLDEIRAELPQYGEVGVGRDDGQNRGEYSAILYRGSRFASALGQSGTFWFSDTPETPGSKHWGNSIPRICTWVRLIDRSANSADAGGSPPLAVYNVHLDHQSEPSRQKSVEALKARILAQRAAGERLIITGDFNCGESSPGIRSLKAPALVPADAPATPSDWPGVIDTFRAIHPDLQSVGTFHAFKGGSSGEKIDYIFVERNAQTLAAEILHTAQDGRFPSDHHPVTARVRWPLGRQPTDR